MVSRWKQDVKPPPPPPLSLSLSRIQELFYFILVVCIIREAIAFILSDNIQSTYLITQKYTLL
jgi:hypothetical protein